MTVKSSVSLTDSQDRFARELVETGRYPTLSAVIQRGLELLRAETEERDLEMYALRHLLVERMKGPFVGFEDHCREVDEILDTEFAVTRAHGNDAA